MKDKYPSILWWKRFHTYFTAKYHVPDILTPDRERLVFEDALKLYRLNFSAKQAAITCHESLKPIDMWKK
jgi:hypothetical protein